MSFAETRPRHFHSAASAAAALLLVAVLLFVTEWSRAVALVVLSFGMVLAAGTMFALRRGRWPSRLWRAGFSALAVAALAYGLGLYVYGLMHPPIAV